MKPIFLALVVLGLTASVLHAQDRIGPAPSVVLTLGSSIDLATSLSAIHSGRGKEGNPFLAHIGTPGLVAWKAGATTGMLVLLRKLAAEGHPKLAKTIGYVGGVALGGLGVHNARVGRQ